MGDPADSVYITCSDGQVDHLMVFASEEEAEKYAERHGHEVLPSEPVFATAADCEHWCYGTNPDDPEEEE